MTATTMTIEEREAFLEAVHIGVLAIPENERGPLTVPIWYEYEPGGELWMTTGKLSRKGQCLRKGARVSLCVQEEEPPYKYVSVEGPIMAIENDENVDGTRRLAHRYLGESAGDDYISMMRDFMESVVPIRVSMRPERWLTFNAARNG